MKKVCIYLLVSLVLQFISVVNTDAQNQKIDSLLKISSQRNLGDTLRIKVYNELSEEYIKVNSNEAIPYAQKALVVSQKLKNDFGAAKAYTNLGTHYMYANELDTAFVLYNKALSLLNKNATTSLYAELQKKKGAVFYYGGNTDSALHYFKSSLTIYERLNDSLEIIKAYNNIGAISLKTRKLDQAISYFFKCLFFDENKNDLKSIASDYNNIGIALMDKKDFLAAQTYLMKVIKIREVLKDSIGIARASLNLGNVYIGQKKYTETIKILNSLYSLLNENEYPDEYSHLLNNLGLCYMYLNENDLALDLFNKSLKIKRQNNIDKDLENTLGNLGIVYSKQKNYPQAILYSLEAETSALKSGQIEVQRSARIILTECYLKTNQSNLAFESFQILKELNEKFYNLNSAQQVAEIQTKYETEKKENENKLLLQQNDIKQLEIIANEQKIKSKNITIIILIISILLITIIVLWWINLTNLRKKEKELALVQKIQKEKERISRDLHDNVGGQLSYVLYSLDGITSRDSKKQEEISKSINDSVRQVISNLRETIWAINDENIPIQDFSDKLKVYTRTIFRHSAVEVKFQEKIENSITLNSLVGLNLFRICQEIINNVFKHAEASLVTISIESTDKISVTISDNGKGFELDSENEGYGLTNIKKRAEETGISVEMSSAKGSGVTYKLIV
jgi:signal transduction histidine kinase